MNLNLKYLASDFQIVGPTKRTNKHACALSKELLKRTANAIEPYIQGFFNNVLILGKTSESEVSDYLYDLIYELYQVNYICV